MIAARLAVLVLLVAACDAGEDEGTSSESSSSGELDCETSSVITYDTFGRGFLAAYCNGCHGGAVANRQGAPGGTVFDTVQGASMHADRIAVRVLDEDDELPPMPPSGGVTPDDRERVRVWLTCFR